MQDLSESHPIAGVFTPRLVARLQREAFDGALRFHSGSATRVVYFRRGDIASAASNAEADRLHNILINEGRLSGPQVDMARSRLRPGTTLGKTLIDLGFLTPSELLSGARRQVKQILSACFTLAEGVYQVAPGPVGPEVTNLGLPVRRLIFDAVMESGDRQTIVGEMGSMESIYGPATALGDALATMRLDASAEEVARRLDGRATLRDISGRTHLDDFTVSKIVLALEIMGLAELVSRPEDRARREDAARPAVAIAGRPGRVIPIQSDSSEDETAAASPEPVPSNPVPVLVSVSSGGRAPAVQPVADAETPSPEASPPQAAEPPRAEPDADPRPARVDDDPPLAAGGGPDDFGDRDEEDEDEGEPPAEPPPFSRDELPAFAVPETAEGGWSINPETGERVHEGPVEMIFDGPVVPRSRLATTGRRSIGIGVVVAVVLVAAFLAFRLRAPSSMSASEAARIGAAGVEAPATEDSAAIEDHPAGAETSPVAEAARDVQAEPDAQPPRAVEPPPAADPAAGKERPSPTPASTAELPAPTPVTAPPPVAAPTTAPAASAAAPPVAARAAEATKAADDLGSGQARLDAGDVDGATAIFSRMIAASPAETLTLQVLIACEAENILKGRNATRPDGPLFVVPFRLQGRSCWRVCWGRYGDRDAARSAAGALPRYFTAAGVTPVVVSFGRLRPAG